MKNVSFMILADAHLDSDFAKECHLRREEQRRAFDKAVAMAAEFEIEYLLVPGDLFDERSPRKETVDHVKKAFGGLAKTKVIIAAGNHDPIANDSPYAEGDWPHNVYIFPSKKITMLEFSDRYRSKLAEGRGDSFLFRNDEEELPRKKGVRIYGASFEGHFARETLLCDEQGAVPKLSSAYVNILLMHGEADVTRSMYNPLPKNIIRECGFDLCALGHVHGYKKTDDYIYSGVLCSRGFDEQGDCGVVAGEITGDGRVLTEFIPINVRKYVTEEFDVTEENDLSPEALSEMIMARTDKTLCTRVLLKGSIPLNEKINADGLQMKLTGHYPQVQVVDNTSVEADWRLIAEENSLRGIFVRKMLEKLRDTEDTKYTRQNIQDAMKVGIKAFNGKL